MPTSIPYNTPFVGRGNIKIGSALTFSLPSRITCPGASPWCLNHCYALRYERLRPFCLKAYSRNLSLSLDADTFAKTMMATLPHGLRCLRIHVSGDFYSRIYCQKWIEICKARPDIVFWCYTRSWAVPALLAPLEVLRSLPNVHLLASCDMTMPLPPTGWRVAFVQEDPRATGMPCKKQHGRATSCQTCGYCMFSNTGHVVFNVH